jgi:hypothetical protein
VSTAIATDNQREAANRRVLDIFQQAQPAIIDIRTARDVIPDMDDNLILHAGPPIAWAAMCGPMQGAILGALVYEDRSPDIEAGRALCESGAIRLAPCHDHAAVAPMAGVISPSMPVWVIEDPVNGTRAYSNLNEGAGRALRYGANGPDVLERLYWMRDSLAPRLRKTIQALGSLPLFPLIREALRMGDECHSRNRAALSLLVQTLIPGLLDADLSSREIEEITRFIIGRDYFFLNLTMAACKAAWMAAESVPFASIVTALSRNGVEFGIRLQGQWFTAPSPVVDGQYFAGFTATDANLDIGDSAITEASGLGGFAVGGAPAITNFIGGTAQSLMESMTEMYQITVAESQLFQLPILEERGTPVGIDVLKVVETGIRPFITTGIAHRLPGIGQIGAGRVRAPLQCFERAVTFIGDQLVKIR